LQQIRYMLMPGKKIPVLLLFIFCLVIGTFGQNETKSDEILKEADVLIASGNLQAALEKAKTAVDLDPSYHPALLKEINILYLMKDEKQSMSLVDEAIKKFPDVPGYYYMRGIINNSRSKFIKALDDFTSAIDMNPKDILYRCYLGRGVSFYNLLEYESALSDLNLSIQQNDTVASAYYTRGLINYDAKDYEAAASDFQKTLEYSRGNAALYFNLGMSYYRLEEKDKACPNFNKACTMGNTNACRMSLMECAKAIPSAGRSKE
jgi:tetratricopeptide (TPR) repeat protein